MLKIPVLNRAGEIVFKADAGEAARMLALGQATSTSDGRCLRLTGFTSEKEHSGRTRTSRGGILASCGRSQQYTTSERGQVTGFKRIYPEDRDLFVTAVLDAIVKKRGGLIVARPSDGAVVVDGCRRVFVCYQAKAAGAAWKLSAPG